jgi:hypothetical protein
MKRLLLAVAMTCAAHAPAAAEAPESAEAASGIADAATAICSAIVFDGQSFDTALAGRPWTSVDPRSTGSELATRAWQATAARNVFLMRLPNGGCSFAIRDGDSETLRVRVMGQLSARATFQLVLEGDTRDGDAVRYAYCTREDFPRVASLVVGGRQSLPRFVFNIYRASDRAPDYCRAAT